VYNDESRVVYVQHTRAFVIITASRAIDDGCTATHTYI